MTHCMQHTVYCTTASYDALHAACGYWTTAGWPDPDLRLCLRIPAGGASQCMAEPRTPSNNRGQHAAVQRRGARVRQLPLILPTHHPLGTRQHVNIKPSVVRYRIRVLRLKDRFRICIVCHISIYRRLTGAAHVQR